MTVLVPSMAYTGVVMTENACYPVFLLAVFLIARAVQQPSQDAQALALLGLGLVAFTRIQGLALVGACLLRSSSTRDGASADAVRTSGGSSHVWPLLVVPSGQSSPRSSRGDGPFGWLGAR